MTPHFRRLGRASLPALWLALSACGGGGPKPRSCATADECPVGSRCLQQTCVANAAPVAVIAPLEALEEHALVTLDGSASHDPDAPGDGVTAFAWRIEAADAPCAAPVVAGAAALAAVRFACAGRYRVFLAVTDQLALQGAEAVREVTVSPRTSPELVQASPDVVLGHRCAGTPLLCTPAGEVALAAAATGAQGSVRFAWSVVAPQDRPLDAARRVSFLPGADAQAPLVALETDGTAISGDWVFVVEASDDAGVLGRASTRVSVGNEPPQITAKVAPFPHRFNAESATFTVSDALPVQVVDPDGDPLVDRAVTFRHAGDGGALFAGQDLGDRIGFDVVVRYTAPSDAAYLIGGAGLERSIGLSVRDVNGAAASAAWPVEISNQPPHFLNPAAATVGHAFDAAGQRYLATADGGTVLDPEGDPLEQGAPTGDVACDRFSVVGGHAVVECALPYQGVPMVANLTGAHRVSLLLRDPWTPAAATVTTSVTITDRAPRIVTTPLPVASVACSYLTTCCQVDPQTKECLETDVLMQGADWLVAGRVVDDDGDPLTLSHDGTSVVCVGDACQFTASRAPSTVCGISAAGTVVVTASDGDQTTTDGIPISRTCAP